MKKDTEVKLYMQERRKGTTQRIAAARAGISEHNSRVIPPYKPLPCLPCSVSNTLSGIVRPRYEPCNGI